MAKFKVGDKVITTVECFGIPAGEVATVVKVYWEDVGLKVKACYGLLFNDNLYHSTPYWSEDDWAYYETEVESV